MRAIGRAARRKYPGYFTLAEDYWDFVHAWAWSTQHCEFSRKKIHAQMRRRGRIEFQRRDTEGPDAQGTAGNRKV